MHRVYIEKMFLIIVIIMCFMSIIKLIFRSCYIDKIIKKFISLFCQNIIIIPGIILLLECKMKNRFAIYAKLYGIPL